MTVEKSNGPAESRKWLSYFSLRSMTTLHVSRRVSIQLTAKELQAITKSIQQFQLGEGSRGQRLLERGRKFGRLVNDPYFAEALDQFIKEEQQHSRYLDAFMESQSIPVVPRHWVDTVFRRMRGLAGLELSLTVLVTAEIIAVPYYRALRGATGSSILKMICTRILDDEANHLKYQASMLARVRFERPHFFQRALSEIHRLFLLGTLIVVWREHRAVFEAGGYDFQGFRRDTICEFSNWDQSCQTLAAALPLSRKLLLGNSDRIKPRA
jgi:rubrerythrin